jgi:hypothetical protein
LPAPEELGLMTAPAAAPAAPTASVSGMPVSWASARNRLEQLGATYYRLEKAAEGGYRFSCALPYPQSTTKQRNFEVRAASEEEAVREVMQEVEQWRATLR